MNDPAFRIEFSQEAKQEFREIKAYYKRLASIEVRGRFVSELDAYLALIS